MAKRRIRRKTAKKTTKAASSGGRKRKLSLDEMLKRIPSKDYLTTSEVQHIFNDAHEVTIYKMVGRGEITAYRTRNRGKANCYKRDEIERAVRARFEPEIAPTSKKIMESGDGGDDQAEEADGKAGSVRKRTRARKKKAKKKGA